MYFFKKYSPDCSLLEYCPGGKLFVFLCFALRTVEAIATAAFETACFSILANTFPDKVATVMVRIVSQEISSHEKSCL